MARVSIHVTALLASLLSVGAAGCRDTVTPFESPASMDAPEVRDRILCVADTQGQFAYADVTLRNDSDLAWLLRSTSISGTGAQFVVEGLTQRLVPAGQSISGRIRCERQRERFATGFGTIEFTDLAGNNRRQRSFTIHLVPSDSTLEFSSDRLNFGNVIAGEFVVDSISLQNRGASPAMLQSADIMNAREVLGVERPTIDAFPITIAPEERVRISLVFRPQDSSRIETALRLEHTGTPGGAPTSEFVTLLGNESKPCIRVTHEDGFAFDDVVPGEVVSEVFSVSNCSGGEFPVDLLVREISLAQTTARQTSENFSLTSTAPTPARIQSDSSIQFTLSYRSPGETFPQESGWVEILSNDSLKSSLYIPITAYQSTNACPISRVSCAIPGNNTALADGSEVDAGTTIRCSGLGSIDSDGTISGYFWGVLPARPTIPITNVEEGIATIRFPQAGDYSISLQTIDDRGRFTCEPASFSLRVVESGFRVEVFWSKPAEELDPATGEGADLDLRMIDNTGGCWGDTFYDCNSSNRSPDWGLAGDRTDNPLFNPLFAGEPGAERIRYLNPVASEFRFGVEYAEDLGIGAVIVVMRLHVLGILAFDIGRELTTAGQFWEIGTLRWPSGEFVPMDTLHDSIADSICP
jgi:hypothetical protein